MYLKKAKKTPQRMIKTHNKKWICQNISRKGTGKIIKNKKRVEIPSFRLTAYFYARFPIEAFLILRSNQLYINIVNNSS